VFSEIYKSISSAQDKLKEFSCRTRRESFSTTFRTFRAVEGAEKLSCGAK